MAASPLTRVVNARIAAKPGFWDIDVSDGTFTRIAPHLDSQPSSSAVPGTLDAQGRLLSPPFVEPHVHLDAALTAGEPAWNQSGTLFEGVQRWSERKATLTLDDVLTRARKAMTWQAAQGIQFVRAHCDVTDPNLTALKALLQLKDEMAEAIELQIVAFPQEGIVSYPRGAELVEEALRLGADAVGATPHLEFTRDDGVTAVKKAFELAERYSKLVDIHCDEIDDEQSRFLEVVAAEALHRGMGSRVTASHTTAMGSYNDAYAFKLLQLLVRAGIHFVANPLVNIHLQGRFDTYPKRRGLTRVKELLNAGINVCFGHDDLADPWYPLGTSNMLEVLHMGLHVCQLMGFDDLNQSLRLITTHSARTMNVADRYGIEPGKPASFVLLDAESEYDALRRRAAVMYSVRNGRLIAQTAPAETVVHFGANPGALNFSHTPAHARATLLTDPRPTQLIP